MKDAIPGFRAAALNPDYALNPGYDPLNAA